jgi:hypothetical protein
MPKLFAIAIAATSLAFMACISSSGSSPSPHDSGPSQPDGSIVIVGADDAGDATAIVPVDAGDAAPPVPFDGGVDASTFFPTGLGSGVVAHSAHFSLITKTGMEPGGAGVHSSTSFKMISGVAPAGTK